VVQALARGEEPTVGGALRTAAPRLPAAVGAVALYTVAVAAGLFALVITGILGAALGAILREIENGGLYTSGYVLLQAVIFSLGAIFGTLLFFDSRARSSLPWQGPSPGDWVAPEPPERPIMPPRI
jgi:hypothetical protein